jgi:hypothetical protein
LFGKYWKGIFYDFQKCDLSRGVFLLAACEALAHIFCFLVSLGAHRWGGVYFTIWLYQCERVGIVVFQDFGRAYFDLLWMVEYNFFHQMGSWNLG